MKEKKEELNSEIGKKKYSIYLFGNVLADSERHRGTADNIIKRSSRQANHTLKQ